MEQLFKENSVRKILDLGCGTGRHAIYFARKGYEVSGFDWSENAVMRAEGLFKARNLRADLRVWDMTRLPYPYEDGSFDGVVANKVIHHAKLETIKRIFGEIERITLKGGFLYLNVPSMEEVLREMKEGEKMEEIEPGTYLPLEGDEKGILHHHFVKEELVSVLSESGYNPIDAKMKKEKLCVIARKKGS